MPEEKRPFYNNGLHFTCQRCSNCCRHEPGYVFLSRKDVQRMSRCLALPAEKFIHGYCREIDISGFKRVSLTEKPNYDCIFWENGRCLVYKARPLQCASYPFWERFLHNEEIWNGLEKSCPGVNHGKLRTCREISGWLRKRLQEPFINSGIAEEQRRKTERPATGEK